MSGCPLEAGAEAVEVLVEEMAVVEEKEEVVEKAAVVEVDIKYIFKDTYQLKMTKKSRASRPFLSAVVTLPHHKNL
jgi:hypothetical protein